MRSCTVYRVAVEAAAKRVIIHLSNTATRIGTCAAPSVYFQPSPHTSHGSRDGSHAHGPDRAGPAPAQAPKDMAAAGVAVREVARWPNRREEAVGAGQTRRTQDPAPRSESTLRLDLGRGAEERGAAAAALQRLHHGYAMRTSRANRRRPRRRPPHGGGEAAAARRWRGLRRQAEADGGDGVGEGGGHGGALIAPTSLRGSGGHGRFLSAGARRR